MRSSTSNGKSGRENDKFIGQLSSTTLETSLRDFLVKSGASAMLADTPVNNKTRSSTAQPQYFPPINRERDNSITSLDNQVMDDITDEISPPMESYEAAPSHKSSKSQKKLVSGTQFRIPQKDPVTCAQCDNYDKLLKKLKESNRMLRLQISRLEEKVHDLRRARPEGGASDPTPDLDADSLLEAKAAINARCEQLEAELFAMRRRCNDADQDRVKAECQVMASSREIQEGKEEMEYMKTLMARLKEDCERSERELAACKLNLTDSLQDNQRLTAKAIDDAAKSAAAIAALQAELEALKSNAGGSQAKCAALETTIEGLNSRVKGLEAEKERMQLSLQRANEKQASKDSELIDAESRFQDAFAKLEQRGKDYSILQNCLDERTTEVAVLHSQLSPLQRDLQTSEQRQLEMLRKLTADSESTKKALEKAITSSVRLCVVAPTVNVHIPDRKMNLKTSVSDVALREFLSSEVLEKYTFLFKQRSENASPEEGVAIQVWVETMLKNMQSAIEQHVRKAIDGVL